RGRLDGVSVQREGRVARHDDVHLLVAELLLGVLLDDPVADLLGRVGVDPEGGDTEPASDRPPLQPFHDRNAVELVEARDAAGNVLRSASSTTGSIRSTPFTRSSRFSLPAQRRRAPSRSPSKPSLLRRSESSVARSASTSIHSCAGVLPNSCS